MRVYCECAPVCREKRFLKCEEKWQTGDRVHQKRKSESNATVSTKLIAEGTAAEGEFTQKQNARIAEKSHGSGRDRGAQTRMAAPERAGGREQPGQPEEHARYSSDSRAIHR